MASRELTLRSLEHLGAGNTINFLYTGYAVSGEGPDRRFAPNSFQYQGLARLIRSEIPGGEIPPSVPEPTTIVLFGTGLAGMTARMWKRKRMP